MTYDMLIGKEPFWTSLFEHLFDVTVLNLHVIMMKPEIKLIISVARLNWS